MDLSTTFVKRAGGEHGGDWSARVTVVPRVRTVNKEIFFLVLILFNVFPCIDPF